MCATAMIPTLLVLDAGTKSIYATSCGRCVNGTLQLLVNSWAFHLLIRALALIPQIPRQEIINLVLLPYLASPVVSSSVTLNINVVVSFIGHRAVNLFSLLGAQSDKRSGPGCRAQRLASLCKSADCAAIYFPCRLSKSEPLK